MLKRKEQTLAERIEQARQEAEAFIDAKVAELKASADGRTQPIGALKLMITRGDTCACRIALRLIQN